VAAGAGAWLVVRGVGALLVHAHGRHAAHASRWADLAMAIAGTAVWLPLTKIVLEKTGSALPRVVMKRLGLCRA
jgi:putative peptidoglycan lipid II flippase